VWELPELSFSGIDCPIPTCSVICDTRPVEVKRILDGNTKSSSKNPKISGENPEKAGKNS
jgi:hypothetical protein